MVVKVMFRESCVLARGMWNTDGHVQGFDEAHGEDERLWPAQMPCNNHEDKQSIARWTL